MNIERFLKTGAVLITSALILTGCGNSSLALEKNTSGVRSATQTPEKPSAEITLPTPTERTSKSGSNSESESLSKVNTDLDQVEQTIDKTLDSLDQSLDALDFK